MKNNITPKVTVTEASLLKRVEIFLEDGDFQRADEYCERVLDMNVENGNAYLFKLLAGFSLSKKEQLYDLDEPFDSHPIYGKIIRFGNEELKKEIEEINSAIILRNREKAQRLHYEKALSLAQNEDFTELAQACEIFRSLNDYENSAELLKQCTEKAEKLYDENYNNLFVYIKEKEQEINSLLYNKSTEVAERDNYDRYINENSGKKFFDYSKLLAVGVFLFGIFAIIMASNSFLTEAGISFKTVLRCIFTRIIPGLPLSGFASFLTLIVSRKVIKKHKSNLLEDITTAAQRAKEISERIANNENEALFLQKELDDSLSQLKKLNEEYDAFILNNSNQ